MDIVLDVSLSGFGEVHGEVRDGFGDEPQAARLWDAYRTDSTEMRFTSSSEGLSPTV